MIRMFIYRLVAIILALNYFTFQVELFEEEYEANHPTPAATNGITSPTLTWESFDKNNAPPAFVFDAGLRIDCILIIQPPIAELVEPPAPFQLIRDKSPPALVLTSQS